MLELEPAILAIGVKLNNLGEELRDGKVTLKQASELANIYGKELKQHQLILAERALINELTRPATLAAVKAIEGKSRRLTAAAS